MDNAILSTYHSDLGTVCVHMFGDRDVYEYHAFLSFLYLQNMWYRIQFHLVKSGVVPICFNDVCPYALMCIVGNLF